MMISYIAELFKREMKVGRILELGTAPRDNDRDIITRLFKSYGSGCIIWFIKSIKDNRSVAFINPSGA